MQIKVQTLLYPIPAMVLETPYDQGRYGGYFKGQYGGQGWNEYVRGQNDKNMEIARTKENEGNQNGPSGGPNWGGGNGSGGGGWGVLILIVIALAFIIPAAVAALIGSILMILIVKKVVPSFSALSFGETYIALFWTACTYLGVVTCISFLLLRTDPAINGWVEHASFFTVAKYFLLFGRFHGVILPNLIIVHLIGILIAALVLKTKMRDHIQGSGGYKHSVVATALAILPSLIITSWLTLYVMDKFQL